MVSTETSQNAPRHVPDQRLLANALLKHVGL